MREDRCLVNALHRRIRNTNQSSNKEAVDRRYTDGKKMELKPRLKQMNKPWMKRNNVRKAQLAKVVARPYLAEFGEGSGRHAMRRER